MKERPILVAVIGYLIGILWGLYFKFSIVPYCILIIATYYIAKKIPRRKKFKLISFHRYGRYLKLLINTKAIYILILCSIISNSIILFQNKAYRKAYQDGQIIKQIAIVISQKIEKPYYDLYQVKLIHSKPFNLYIQVEKNSKTLEYGDKIEVQGEYKKPSKKRNYGGYDDEQYLKTLKIVGRMKVTKVKLLAKRQLNPILQLANKTKLQIEQKIENTFEQDKAAILKGLLIGDTTGIQEEIKQDFQTLNISHILAISGMHISYLIIGIQILFKKVLGKKKTKIVTIVFLIFYMIITGFSPSVVRAAVMGMIAIGGGILNRKSDLANTIAISLFIILLYNPFLILNVGLQLSYLGTIGIIIFHPTILEILHFIPLKKIRELMAVTLSAQIILLPIMLYHFNSIGIYFLISNLLVSIVIGPIILLGFLSLFIKMAAIPVNFGLSYLLFISKWSELPFSKIYVPTPNVISIILYLISIVIVNQIYKIYHQNEFTLTKQRVKNIIALFYYRFQNQKKLYLKYFIMIFIIIISLFFLPKQLKIYFVDVGQGDCSFIVTPQNKTILIDGGGSLRDEFDVGKKILIPYLLDRGYLAIDYIVISHVDQDHIGRIIKCNGRAKSKKCHNRKAI